MLRASAVLLLGAATLAVAGIAIDHLCIVPWRGNLALRQIEERSQIAQSLDARRAALLARTNLDDLVHEARGRELDPAWYLLYGANCELLGRWAEAADTYSQALRIDDRPEIYENRGLAMLNMGRTDQAVSDLAIAARFDPRVLDQLDGELRARVAAAVNSR